jgi:hypothetical protein
MTMPSNPLYAASHVQMMAERVRDNRMSNAFMFMSAALLLLMLIREGRELIASSPRKEPLPQNEHQRHNSRQLATRIFDRDEISRRSR